MRINRSAIIIFLVAILSCIFVVFDLAFQKPFHPNQVAKSFNESPGSLMLVSGYNDPLDIAVGLSYALALEGVRTEKPRNLCGFSL